MTNSTIHRTITKASQRVRVVLRDGEIFDHHKIGLAHKPLGPTNAIQRFGDRWPKLRRVFIRGERDSIETPRE